MTTNATEILAERIAEQLVRKLEPIIYRAAALAGTRSRFVQDPHPDNPAFIITENSIKEAFGTGFSSLHEEIVSAVNAANGMMEEINRRANLPEED